MGEWVEVVGVVVSSFIICMWGYYFGMVYMW